MKKICVLVDFSPASKIAINYACSLATEAGATLQLLHVAGGFSDTDLEKVKRDLVNFTADTNLCHQKQELIVTKGDFVEQVPNLLLEHKAELAIIATHGVRGIFHTMQGPEVLKLVQKIHIPSLVIQNQTPKEFSGYKTILFPISPHHNIEVKIDQTAKLAKIFNSKILIYVLTPEEGELEDILQKNLAKVQAAFKEQKIEFEEVYETSKVYGIGYARQALEFVGKREVDLFAIMAHASDEHSYFGNVERSEFILNKKGTPVLCCAD